MIIHKHWTTICKEFQDLLIPELKEAFPEIEFDGMYMLNYNNSFWHPKILIFDVNYEGDTLYCYIQKFNPIMQKLAEEYGFKHYWESPGRR